MRTIPTFKEHRIGNSLAFKGTLLDAFTVEFETPHLGFIIGEGWKIPFNLSSNGHITCWMNDLIKLPSVASGTFLKFLIKSNHKEQLPSAASES